MVRASKTSDENPSSSSNINTEAKERNRLKSLAFSKKILSQAPAKSDAHLSPSKTVLKHHGKDIIKKSQRKNRFLFSFPGLIAPVGGGKIGELKDLGTKNPILYLDFPQGQMKLFGTIVYPENRYLTLQFSKGGKNVMCEDYFDNMIVFSDAWWIGRKDENPNEARLEFPKDLIDVKGEHTENDFKAGAGSSIVYKSPAKEMLTTIAKEQLPKIPTEDPSSDDDNSLKEQMEVTPVRHSERNMGKKFSYVEASSGDDSNGGDIAAAHAAEEKDAGSFSAHSDIEVRDAMEKVEQSEEFSVSVSRSKKGSPSSTTKSKETSHSSHGSLVQATISTLFKKVEEKTVPKKRERPQSASVPGRKSLRTNSKKKVNQEGPTKKRKLMTQKDAGLATIAKHKDSEVEKDPIEELSSSSKGTDGSDDEWSG